MTKLNRLTAKIFGETASTTNTPKEIGQFGSAKAGTYNATGDVATIQSLPAWSNGWIDAVTPTDQFPPLPEMTGVHKVLSYQIAYLLQQGIPEWDSATTYYENGFCSYNGTIYKSLQDNNLNQQPDTASSYWEVYGAISDYANQDLTNLTTLGNARLQYAPFSINAGTVENGGNSTLINPTSPTIVEKSWNQIFLSSDTPVGGDECGVDCSSAYPGFNAYYAFSNSNGGWMPNGNSGYITFYSPVAIKVDSIMAQFYDASYPSLHYTTSLTIYGSTDNSNWTELKNYTPSRSGRETVTINSNNFYNYLKFQVSGSYPYIKYTEIIASYQETVQVGSTIICNPCTITTADGRTKVFNSAATYDVPSVTDGDYLIFKDYSTGALNLKSGLEISKVVPSTPTDDDYWLDYSIIPANLKVYDSTNDVWNVNNNFVYIGDCTISSGAVRAVSNNIFNDNGYSQGSSTSAKWAMPSGTYKNITIGASGTTYTAPSNGYFYFGHSGNANVALFNTSSVLANSGCYIGANIFGAVCFVPAKKGDNVQIFYTSLVAPTSFLFVYAEGSKEES